MPSNASKMLLQVILYNPKTIKIYTKMADESNLFMERVRNSFSNAKNDILKAEQSVLSLKKEVESNKQDISSLNNKIDSLNKGILEIKDILSTFKQISTGNNGVSQQSSTIINNSQQSTSNAKQSSTVPINAQQSIPREIHHNTPKKTLQALELDFEMQFRSLTDREFSVFMTILELEKQGHIVDFSLMANHLNLTETTVRGVANRLISKGLPVRKERHFNGRTSLLIKEAFHDLNLLNKLIRLRGNPTDQTTLFN